MEEINATRKANAVLARAAPSNVATVYVHGSIVTWQSSRKSNIGGRTHWRAPDIDCVRKRKVAFISSIGGLIATDMGVEIVACMTSK